MIRWTGLTPWEFEFPFLGSLTSTFLVHGRSPLTLDRKRGRADQIGDPEKNVRGCILGQPRAASSGFRVSGFGVWVSGFGFRVQGSGSEVRYPFLLCDDASGNNVQGGNFGPKKSPS